MEINWEALIAGLALILSTYSFFSSQKTNRELNRQQKEINNLILKKEEEYFEEKKKAKFTAYVVKNSNHYKVHITNQGQGTAKDTRIEILIDDKYKNYFFDIDQIFPMKEIRTGQVAKIGYSRGMDFPSKFNILIKWNDEDGKDKEDEIEVIT